MQLKDQAAIVTGGASGLGAATARRLAAQGAKVAVCDLNMKLAETVAAEIKGVAVSCDVSDAASAEAAIAAHEALGLRHLSRVDLIVDPDGQPWFLEANVLPGLTETSLVPLAIEAAGFDLGAVYAGLAEQAIRDGLALAGQ